MRLCTSLLLLLPKTSLALYKDEAGINDFLLSSAGHGHSGITYAQSLDDAVITSSSPFNPNSILGVGGGDDDDDGCHVASRNVNTGELNFRRSVCSSAKGTTYGVYTSKSTGVIYTIDEENVVRGWDGIFSDGSLLFDYAPPSISEKEEEEFSLPRIWGAEHNNELKTIISTSIHGKNGDIVRFCHPTTGKPLSITSMEGEKVESLNTNDLLKISASNGADEASFMLGLVTLESNKIAVLVGYATSASSLTTSFDKMALVQLSIVKDGGNDSTYSLKIDSSNPIQKPASTSDDNHVQTSSIQSFAYGSNKLLIVGIAPSKQEIVAHDIDIDIIGDTSKPLKQKWSIDDALLPSISSSVKSLESISIINENYIQVSGINGKNNDSFQSLLNYEPAAKLKEVKTASAIGFCAEYNWVITSSSSSSNKALAIHAVSSEDKTTKVGEITLFDMNENDDTKNIFLLSCTQTNVKVMVTTYTGTTQVVSFSKMKTDDEEITLLWSTEEALGSITSTAFLDETHPPKELSSADDNNDMEDEDEEVALQSLSFSSRLASQLQSLQSFILSGGVLSSSLITSLFAPNDDKKQRDYAFGFAKVAVLLSEPLSKLLAIDTANNGKILWSMGLNQKAKWHKMLHGGPNGNTIVESTVGTHSHEILALSYVPSSEGGGEGGNVEWKCLDGTRGKTFTSSTSATMSSQIAQIIPLHSPALIGHVHDGGGCRQMALLLHEDDTLSVVPDTKHSRSVVLDVIKNQQNGMFVHKVNKETGKFITMNVTPVMDEGMVVAKATVVGETTFNPSTEKIVNVVYPQRGEFIQSPASILGDDSLLLKYLNPHLAVVVTVATEDEFVSDSFYKALDEGASNGSDGGKTKKKPLGATKPGEETPATAASSEATPPPTLFINLMDTVSGQILYRASHAHRDTDSGVSSSSSSSSNIPVVFTENWIIYAYPNARTRRTDIGVLSLHEGMIDKHGITAFASPEQEMTFSSFESAKPIVLSKTYGIAKTVTAIGVTTTKGGISSKQVLLATNGDQIISVDKRFLDPRRPSGELKQSEKEEGLMKYAPLLPVFSLRTPSYNQTVESVHSIVSMPTYVESQSLVLAFGGPDIFFTRLAPSKGFDLLPDDFNRPLLAMVVLGLIFVMNTVKTMGTKKMVGMSWS